MTLLKKHLGTEFGDVQFNVQSSILYHTARQKHYEFRSKMTSYFIIVATGISGLIFAEQDAGWWRFILPTLVLIVSALDLVFKPSKMLAIHKMLANQFIRLDMKMTSSENKGNPEAKNFHALNLEIESDEPPILEVPNVLSYNKLCASLGSNQEIRYMGRFRTMFAQWIFWPQEEWIKLDEHKARKQRTSKKKLQVSA